jgi:hypothetical protein
MSLVGPSTHKRKTMPNYSPDAILETLLEVLADESRFQTILAKIVKEGSFVEMWLAMSNFAVMKSKPAPSSLLIPHAEYFKLVDRGIREYMRVLVLLWERDNRCSLFPERGVVQSASGSAHGEGGGSAARPSGASATASVLGEGSGGHPEQLPRPSGSPRSSGKN